MSRLKRYDGTDWQPVDGAEISTPSAPTFNPWGGDYPVPLHAVWASDPNWSNPGNGNAVTTWRNPSGASPTQGTSGNRPTFRSSTAALNSRATVQFDGTNDFLSVAISVSGPFVVVAVAQSLTTAATQGFMGINSSSGGAGLGSSGAAWAINWGTNQVAGTSDTNPHVFVARQDDSSDGLWVDGSSVISANAGTNGLDRFLIGSRSDTGGSGNIYYWNGHIAYLGIYRNSTRDSAIQSLEAGLGAYYGITIA